MFRHFETGIFSTQQQKLPFECYPFSDETTIWTCENFANAEFIKVSFV